MTPCGQGRAVCGCPGGRVGALLPVQDRLPGTTGAIWRWAEQDATADLVSRALESCPDVRGCTGSLAPGPQGCLGGCVVARAERIPESIADVGGQLGGKRARRVGELR